SIFGLIQSGQDSAKYFGMQGLQSAVHHLGKAGVAGNIFDRHTRRFQMLARAAGAVDFHSGSRQSLGELIQARLITDTDQRTRNGRRFHANSFGDLETSSGKTTPLCIRSSSRAVNHLEWIVGYAEREKV